MIAISEHEDASDCLPTTKDAAEFRRAFRGEAWVLRTAVRRRLGDIIDKAAQEGAGDVYLVDDDLIPWRKYMSTHRQRDENISQGTSKRTLQRSGARRIQTEETEKVLIMSSTRKTDATAECTPAPNAIPLPNYISTTRAHVTEQRAPTKLRRTR